MDFELSEDQRAFRDLAESLTKEHILPNAARWDEEKILKNTAASASAGSTPC